MKKELRVELTGRELAVGVNKLLKDNEGYVGCNIIPLKKGFTFALYFADSVNEPDVLKSLERYLLEDTIEVKEKIDINKKYLYVSSRVDNPQIISDSLGMTSIVDEISIIKSVDRYTNPLNIENQNIDILIKY